MTEENSIIIQLKKIQPRTRLRSGVLDACRMMCSVQLSSLDIVETNFRELVDGQLCGISVAEILEKH